MAKELVKNKYKQKLFTHQLLTKTFKTLQFFSLHYVCSTNKLKQEHKYINMRNPKRLYENRIINATEIVYRF